MQETLTIQTSELKNLLIRTQSKSIAQVEGTEIEWTNGCATTCNIVRDGITSLSMFSEGCGEGKGSIVIASLSMMLGALSKHKGEVSLTQNDGKIKIVSQGKQTTVISDERAKAFTHTKKTVREWAKDSGERYFGALLQNEGKYTASTGDVIEPCAESSCMVGELLDALDSGSINGQKLSQYLFHAEDGLLFVSVGAELKGRTKTLVSECDNHVKTIVGGGLENVLRTMTGSVSLKFFDLTPLGGGISLLIEQLGMKVFQREVAGVASD